MEINLRKLTDKKIETTAVEKKMRLSDESTSFVFQMFTKHIYSDPIGTIVREITSNCFDSHVEANVDFPVIIKLSENKEENNYQLSFIDFGMGMSPERIENIYGVYFESSKRLNNSQIGGFGVGGKSPLAYKRYSGYGSSEYDNSFYVITIYNNIKYYYCIYEGNESPVITLLYTEQTEERNGTEIRIPVLKGDISKFINAIKKQLYYFENIIFEGFEIYSESLPERLNKYQIINANNFLFRGGEYENNIHVCLGKVAYPINYSTLQLSSDNYRFPVALKFNVGELNVTVSRESLDYNDTTIKIIKEKLELAVSEIKEMIKKQYENVITLEDYNTFINNTKELRFPNGNSFNIGNTIKTNDIETINFKYNAIKKIFSYSLFDKIFEIKYVNHHKREKLFASTFNNLMANTKKIFYVEGDLDKKRIKSKYLKDTYNSYAIIRKAKIDVVNCVLECSENTISKNYVDNNINLFNELIDEYYNVVKKYCHNYNDLIVPEEYILENKRKKISKDILKEEIVVTLYNGDKCKITIEELNNFKGRIIYGSLAEKNMISTAYSIFSVLFPKTYIVKKYWGSLSMYNNSNTYNNSKSYNSIMFITVPETKIKYIKQCTKVIHVSEFSKKMLKRKINLIKECIEFNDVFSVYNNINKTYDNHTKIFKFVNEDFYNKLIEIKKYVDNFESKLSGKLNDTISTSNAAYKMLLNDNIDIKLTNSNKSYLDLVNQIKLVSDFNQEIFKYINFNYYDTYSEDHVLVKILKNSMVL